MAMAMAMARKQIERSLLHRNMNALSGITKGLYKNSIPRYGINYKGVYYEL
jgi:hypothetical protein